MSEIYHSFVSFNFSPSSPIQTMTSHSSCLSKTPFAVRHSNYIASILHVSIVLALTICCLPVRTSATRPAIYRRPTSICPSSHWLNTALDACEPCSDCVDDRSIVLRPCQPHRDTVCGTLNDLEFEWSWMAPPVLDAVNQELGAGQDWNEVSGLLKLA